MFVEVGSHRAKSNGPPGGVSPGGRSGPSGSATMDALTMLRNETMAGRKVASTVCILPPPFIPSHPLSLHVGHTLTELALRSCTLSVVIRSSLSLSGCVLISLMGIMCQHCAQQFLVCTSCTSSTSALLWHAVACLRSVAGLCD